ncbi:MAG: winged helix-turn-helix transcriptional regulator [Eubacterium sp.]|nr:winged helix-turn-helix transcriptional regulator [Eubacterium sp.]
MPLSQDQRYYMKLKALTYLYEDGLTQTEIAKRLNISRVTLNRLLDEARSEGMIKFEIVDVRGKQNAIRLEKKMCELFGLADIRLIDAGSADEKTLNDRIGAEAALYIEQKLRSDMKIGLTWGRTLNNMIQYLTPNARIRDLTLYTLVGGASTSSNFQPNLLAQRFINKYSGKTVVITAPFICQHENLCKAIKKEPDIANILAASHSLDLTLVGIGEEPQAGADHLSDYSFDKETIAELVNAHAAGDICGNFFDVNGRLCRTQLRNRIVSIDIRDLPSHKCVIGMGGGAKKINSILGALNGHYLHSLITDTQTAEKVIRKKEEMG